MTMMRSQQLVDKSEAQMVIYSSVPPPPPLNSNQSQVHGQFTATSINNDNNSNNQHVKEDNLHIAYVPNHSYQYYQDRPLMPPRSESGVVTQYNS